MAELGWGWSLTSGGITATPASSSGSGMDILSQLVTGKNNNPNPGFATTQATGGGGQQQTDPNFDQPGGSKLDPTNNPPSNQPEIGATTGGPGGDMVGGGDVGGAGMPWYRLLAGANAIGFTPNLGQTSTAQSYGGGGGGGGGAASQKIIYNDRNHTWSMQDPASKKWEDGIATKDIYGRLTGALKDANPEWYYGQSASSADDSRQYELNRQTGQYAQNMGATNQTLRYPTYGI